MLAPAIHHSKLAIVQIALEFSALHPGPGGMPADHYPVVSPEGKDSYTSFENFTPP